MCSKSVQTNIVSQQTVQTHTYTYKSQILYLEPDTMGTPWLVLINRLGPCPVCVYSDKMFLQSRKPMQIAIKKNKCFCCTELLFLLPSAFRSIRNFCDLWEPLHWNLKFYWLHWELSVLNGKMKVWLFHFLKEVCAKTKKKKFLFLYIHIKGFTSLDFSICFPHAKMREVLEFYLGACFNNKRKLVIHKACTLLESSFLAGNLQKEKSRASLPD